MGSLVGTSKLIDVAWKSYPENVTSLILLGAAFSRRKTESSGLAAPSQARMLTYLAQRPLLQRGSWDLRVARDRGGPTSQESILSGSATLSEARRLTYLVWRPPSQARKLTYLASQPGGMRVPRPPSWLAWLATLLKPENSLIWLGDPLLKPENSLIWLGDLSLEPENSLI